MTERQFLERRAELARDRLRGRSAALRRHLVRLVGPTVREHPLLGLALGAVAALALARAVSPRRSGLAPTRSGVGRVVPALARRAVQQLLHRLLERPAPEGAASPARDAGSVPSDAGSAKNAPSFAGSV